MHNSQLINELLRVFILQGREIVHLTIDVNVNGEILLDIMERVVDTDGVTPIIVDRYYRLEEIDV